MNILKRIAPLYVVLSLFAAVSAQSMTPANTEIVNQASATFNDSAGQARTTTSNQVVTIVQQVRVFTITPDGTTATPGQTKRILAGDTAYFNYVLTNTGNGTDTITLSTTTADTFTALTLYGDANCNGIIDSGEASGVNVAAPNTTGIELTAGEAVCLILAAGVGSSTGDLDVSLDGVAGTHNDADNLARATVTTAAAFNARLAGSPSGTVQSKTSDQDEVTYTFTATNNGGSEAFPVNVNELYNVDVGTAGTPDYGLVLTTAVPAGTTFSSFETSLTAAGGGTVHYIYRNGGTWTAGNTPPTTATDVGIVVRTGSTAAFFAQGATARFAYTVTVNGGLAAGTNIIHAAAQLDYREQVIDAGDPNDSDLNLTAASNTVINTVAGAQAVEVGPHGDPRGTGGNKSYSFGGWDVDVVVDDDGDAATTDERQTIAVATTPVYTGDVVVFRNTLRNLGNVADTYSLSSTLAGGPAGPTGTVADWACSLRHADGSTPLLGAVGPISADLAESGNGDFSFSVACIIPNDNAYAFDDTTPVTLTVTATSVADGGKSDTTINVIPAVEPGYSVGVTSNSAGSITLAGSPFNPGQSFSFPVEVENDGGNPDVYNLQLGGLPSEWNAVIHRDGTKGNGACVDVDRTADNSPATNSSLLDPGFVECFVVTARVPSDADPTAGTPLTVTFSAVSTSDAAVDDSVAGALEVSSVNQLVLAPERAGTVTSPGTITYTLNLRNQGNSAATADIVAVTSNFGWTYQLSRDGSTWSTTLDDLTVNRGTPQQIFVRAIVPGGEPIGRVDLVTVRAFYDANGSRAATDPADASAQISTTVVGGDLTLDLSHGGKTTATPGEQIEYELVARNIGTAEIDDVIIMVPLPNYTSYVGATATHSGGDQVKFSTDGVTWSATAPVGVATGEALYVALDTNGNVTDMDDDAVLAPAETIDISLTVRVQ